MLEKENLVRLLKNAVENDDYEHQIQLFTLLGDFYSAKIAENRYNIWQELIYSSGLYNYAYTLADYYNFPATLAELQNKIYQLKIEFLKHRKINYPFTLIEDLQGLETRKNTISKIRNTAENDFKKGLNIEIIYQKMGEDLRKFYIELFEQTMAIIGCNDSIRNKICIALMGSGAIERIHGYSDIDFMVIRSDAHDDLEIELITVLFLMGILNHKEMNLRSFSIPDIDDFMKDYYKYPPSSNGLKFDALRGGVFPLTSLYLCNIENFSYKGTPLELVESFIRHKNCKHIYSIKYINSRPLWGNSSLYNEFTHVFKHKLNEYLDNNMTLGQKIALMQLVGDISRACFKLTDMYLIEHHLMMFQYAIGIIGFYHGLINHTPEQVILWLHQHNKICNEDKITILSLFTWIKSIRLEMMNINRSGNLDIPILWHHSIYKKYYLKTPALIYFLADDLFKFMQLYLMAHKLKSLRFENELLIFSIPMRLQSLHPIIDFFSFIKPYVRRNNFDLNDMNTHQRYTKFPSLFLNREAIEFCKINSLSERHEWLEGMLHFGICIANYYLSSKDSISAFSLLNNLLRSMLELLPQFNIIKTYSKAKVEQLANINPNFPTLIAIIYYLLGRCYFYYPEHFNKAEAQNNFKIATSIRSIIGNLSSTRLINDQYNEHNLDGLIFKRSGILRLQLEDCDKQNIEQLLRIQKSFKALIYEYPDIYNTIECQCMILRIDVFILSVDNFSKVNISKVRQRLTDLTTTVSSVNNYAFTPKINDVKSLVIEAVNKFKFRSNFSIFKRTTSMNRTESDFLTEYKQC